MVESTLIVWEDLDLSPMNAIIVLFIYYCFVIYGIMFWNDIILQFYELARNMNWHDGLALTWH